MSDKCLACGVEWKYHLGITGVCQNLGDSKAELAARNKLIEETLRYLSGDPESDIDWSKIDELFWSYIKGHEDRAETALVENRKLKELLARTSDAKDYCHSCRESVGINGAHKPGCELAAALAE